MHTVQLILRPTEYEKAKKLLMQLDHDNEYLKQKGVRHHSLVPKKVIHFV